MHNTIDAILQERLHQEFDLGWTEEHDDQHVNEELLKAAICMIYNGVLVWPWPDTEFKFVDSERDFDGRTHQLVKAAALIAAEIDRRVRMQDAKDSN